MLEKCQKNARNARKMLFAVQKTTLLDGLDGKEHKSIDYLWSRNAREMLEKCQKNFRKMLEMLEMLEKC